MVTDVIIGGMYGDEGKGKIVDYLTNRFNYDYIFRVNASTNASHCVQKGETTYVTKQLPSVFYPKTDTTLVIGSGALLNIKELLKEIKTRPDLSLLKGKVKIANNISLIIEPYKQIVNPYKAQIGSTNQGTGYGMTARVGKHCLYLYDIENYMNGKVHRAILVNKIEKTMSLLGFPLSDDTMITPFIEDMVSDYNEIKELLGDFSVDFTSFLLDMQTNNPKARVLIEGRNGLLLDNLYGVAPYTTSCSTGINALLNGANISPFTLRDVYVTIGAYTCCLNKRPFVTELKSAEAKRIYDIQDEIDHAEEMRRRVGWLDLPSLKKALVGHLDVNKVKLVVNRLDVLDKLQMYKLCTKYVCNGKVLKTLPDNTLEIPNCEPIYDVLETPQEFLDTIEKVIGLKIAYVGFGPNVLYQIDEWKNKVKESKL